MFPFFSGNLTFFEEEKTPTKPRRGVRDTPGWGHLTEAPKGQAWLHPAMSLTGPPINFSGVFFLFGEGSN
jgi:hypothetical protein